MWEAIDKKAWKDIPVISGRVATEDDVKEGRAVFYIPSGSKHYKTELPLLCHKTSASGGGPKEVRPIRRDLFCPIFARIFR